MAAIRLLAVLSILPIAAVHCHSFNLASSCVGNERLGRIA